MGDELRSYWGRGFFLKVALICTVALIVLPFSAESTTTLVFRTYPSNVPHPPNPSYTNQAFYWSLMSVRITEPMGPPDPDDQLHVGTHWSFLLEYWSTSNPPVGPNTWAPMLQLILTLQVTLIGLGLIALKEGASTRRILPFLLGLLTLDSAYLLLLHYHPLWFGFWISVVATLFASISFLKAWTHHVSYDSTPTDHMVT